MEQNKVTKIAVSICILAVLIIGYLTYMNVSTFLSVRNQWMNKTQELARIKKEVAEIERLMNFYRKEKHDFQQYLFQEKDIPGFLDGLSGFAQNAGINIVDMKTSKFQEVKVPEALEDSQSELAKRKLNNNNQELTKEEMNRMLTLAAMPINIKIKGPYESIVNFYRHLENFKQLVSISNINISTINNDYPVLQCDFTLKIYSLKTLEELKENR